MNREVDSFNPPAYNDTTSFPPLPTAPLAATQVLYYTLISPKNTVASVVNF